jgi:hypothetical protein
MPDIWEAATQLQSELRHRAADYRDIVLVGHSLGGLLIRALVVAALKESRIEDVQRIKHIVTFATPNDGVEIADIVSFFRLPNRQIEDLAMTGKTVNELRGEWIERVYSPNIRPGEERSKRQIPLTTVIGLQDRLVPIDRARSFFRHPPPETVPGDHVSMKLPTDQNSLCYLILRNILKTLCNGDDHGPINPIAGNGESPLERDVEGHGPNRPGPAKGDRQATEGAGRRVGVPPAPAHFIERPGTTDSQRSDSRSTKEPDSVDKLRRQRLEKRLASLSEEHGAVTKQLDASLSAVDRVRLQREIENLEAEMTRVERDLDSKSSRE